MDRKLKNKIEYGNDEEEFSLPLNYLVERNDKKKN